MESQTPPKTVGAKPAKFVSPWTVALYAVLTALTTAVTMTLVIPLPTRGYFNIGDAMVFFSAFTFGWRAGMICGGIGSAMADLLLGFGFFAPITLVAKGSEGLVAGILGRTYKGATWAKILGIWAGGSCMVTTYFVGEWILYGFGNAALELPLNVGQVLFGGLIGLTLSQAISRYRNPNPKTT
jgi:uncharacterized membrane protein